MQTNGVCLPMPEVADRFNASPLVPEWRFHWRQWFEMQSVALVGKSSFLRQVGGADASADSIPPNDLRMENICNHADFVVRRLGSVLLEPLKNLVRGWIGISRSAQKALKVSDSSQTLPEAFGYP